MSKVLVAFGSDGTCGDSCFQPISCGEFKTGITFEEASTTFLAHMKKEWDFPADMSDADFIEEFGDETPTGFWIIEDKLLDLITNIDANWGNDSAVYAGVRTMKIQIQNGADRVLTK